LIQGICGGGGYGKKPPKRANEKASPLIHSFILQANKHRKKAYPLKLHFLATCEIAHLDMISSVKFIKTHVTRREKDLS
jgi:hypothetical protein